MTDLPWFMPIEIIKIPPKIKNTKFHPPRGENLWRYPGKTKLGEKQKEWLYTSLEMMIRSGVDIKTAIEVLAGEDKKLDPILQKIKGGLEKGVPIAVALEQAGGFTSYEIQSIKVGEESGRLPQILKELILYFRRRNGLKKQITSALIYPLIVLSTALLAVTFMLVYVVPMFSSLFSKSGEELPAMTKVVISISTLLKEYGVFILFLMIGVITFCYFNNKKIWFRKVTIALLKLFPILYKLVLKVHFVRFCQAMGFLLTSKTHLVNALDLATSMVKFLPLEYSLKEVREEVIKGISISEAFKSHSSFDPKVIALIKVSEEVNQLDNTFNSLALQMNEEIDHQTKSFIKLLDPILMLFLGGLIGFILLAMYLPIFNLGKGFGT